MRQGVNTIGCREVHAQGAKLSPVAQCPKAGPGGAGKCGLDCDGYCDIMLTECPAIYQTTADCQTACSMFPHSVSAFSTLATTGNTFECRLYHATQATQSGVECDKAVAE